MRFKIFFLVIGSVCLFSCQMLKEIDKKDNSTTDTYKEQIKINRPGTTTTIEIPNVKYKDTTITRINTVDQTILRVNYDNQGNKSIDCETADYIEERNIEHTKQINDIIESLKSEKSFKPEYFIYALIGLVVVLMVFMIMIQRSMNSIQKNLPSLVSEIIKGLN